MAVKIVEFFGYAPEDQSCQAVNARSQRACPFVGGACTKLLSDHEPSGACTVRQRTSSSPIICCPNRLYADGYQILRDIAKEVFGQDIRLVSGEDPRQLKGDGRDVVVYGKRWGKELKLPRVAGRGGFFVDWILAHVGPGRELKDFVAVEVQSMDTTGNYRDQRAAYLEGRSFSGYSQGGGINWENVSKRILPQIIYKGHVLRRESRCTKGLFFVCPTPVYERIRQRLGGNFLAYPTLQPGSLTFRWYNVGEPCPNGSIRGLKFGGQFITTVDQVGLAFTAPPNLPEVNVYEKAITAELNRVGP